MLSFQNTRQPDIKPEELKSIEREYMEMVWATIDKKFWLFTKNHME